MNSSLLIIILVCYFLGLYFISRLANKNGGKLVNNPYTYSLSIAAYCTSWTFYGSVGAATKSGFLFLAIYLGPILCIGIWGLWVKKLIQIKSKYRITSIVDFISARYDKSESLGILAALFIIMGTIPYIALQLKSIIKSTLLLIGSQDLSAQSSLTIGLCVSLSTALMAILFGIRKLDASERHPGMILVLAFECVVKLIAFLAVGIYVTYYLGGGLEATFTKLTSIVDSNYNFMGATDVKSFSVWITYMLLSFSAILFLPRQFHVVVVENFSEKHIKTAKWMFPLYLLLINLFVLPIAIIGVDQGLASSNSDLFVLLLPLKNNNIILATLVYIGGFSAAAGMIMIGVITLSTIFTNHIMLPIISRTKKLRPLTKKILLSRRVFAIALVLISYLYMIILADKAALVSMGLISFAAALQFAPLIIGGIFWSKASKFGAIIGLSLGLLTWLHTLIIPAFVRSDLLPSYLLTHGPFGIKLLRPEALFHFDGMHFLTHAVLWTMFFNLTGYVLGSLLCPQSKTEKILASDFLSTVENEENITPTINADKTIDLNEKVVLVHKVLSYYLSSESVEKLINQTLNKYSLEKNEKIDIMQLSELYSEFEKSLAGAIGTSNANKAILESELLTTREKQIQSDAYAQLISNLNIDPRELNKRIVLYQERESLYAQNQQDLQNEIESRTKELEQQKEKTFNASKLSALGEMAGGIAHEINNPLTIIDMNNRILKKVINTEPLDFKKIEKITETTTSTIRRINKIIVGMRNLSRDVSNEQPEMAKIGDILEDTLALCRDKFKSIGVDLRLDYTADIEQKHIICKRVSISQVLINLLNNAKDAIEGIDKMWIELSIDINEDKNECLFKITDCGPGIPLEIQEKILQPFYTTKPVGKGTGLGLSLSATIVQDHGGTLKVNNEHPNTQFLMSLPINPVDRA